MNSEFSPYADGVPSSSPGLCCTRYPGTSPRKMFQPQRGCRPCVATPANRDGTALRFGSFVAPVPRVGLIAFGQPWAEGRKPVGLGDPEDNGMSSIPPSSSREDTDVLSFSPLYYANGVPSSSPGLRGTRYPGSSPRKMSQPQRGCAHAVTSRALENERTSTLTALDGFLTGLGYV